MLSTSCGKFTVSVVSKALELWVSSASAYSNPARDLPKQQRRGAVIILGMLAVASPKIVETRREDLIKIGLGARGKVNRLALPVSNSDREEDGRRI